MPNAFAVVLLSQTFGLNTAPILAIDLNPLSAIKGLVEAAVENRSAADIKTDLGIKTSIVADVIDKKGSDVISISADVYEQDVMLTGIVTNFRWRSVGGGKVFLFGRALTSEERNKAVRVVKAIEDVSSVTNRVKVKPKF